MSLHKEISVATRKLQATAAPTEIICEIFTKRRITLFWQKQPHFLKIAEAWRLGPLLLATDGQIFSVADAVRSAKRERLGYVAEAQEARRDLAGFAFKSGIPQGTQINYNTINLTAQLTDSSLQPQNSPLVWCGNSLKVLWRPGVDPQTAPALTEFLRERTELLLATANQIPKI